jgi:predicted dehydrogenase
MGRPLGAALVGCGNIAEKYVDTLEPHAAEVAVVGAYDADGDRAERLAGRVGGRAYASLDELLADDDVGLVVNLTPPALHVPVSTAALRAGRHVYSEKPLALDPASARELVEVARLRGLRLGCAPCTFLGEAQQAALEAVRSGALGPVRLAYADCNHGRIEAWHPAPQAFYALGPLADVGVYPLTLLTSVLGPVRSVRAAAERVRETVPTLDGGEAPVRAPDLVVALLRLQSGSLIRLTTTYYVGRQSIQQGVEIHGDEASVRLGDWQRFDAPVELVRPDGTREPLVPATEPYPGIEWARGLLDLARALEEGRPHRTSGEHAAHMVDVLAAIDRAWRGGGEERVRSSFPLPPPGYADG